MKTFKRIANFIDNLLFPPKCVGCREYMQKDIFDECLVPLCEKCRIKWEYENLSECPDCGVEMTLCNCGSKVLQKLGIEEFIKLVNYSASKNTVGRAAVLHMKRKRSSRAFGYFAKQLSYPVTRKIKSEEGKKAIITYVPRSRKGKNDAGFDQAYELAKRLAEYSGVEFFGLFERVRKKTSEQKKLGLSQRIKNSKGTYKLSKNAEKMLDGVDSVFIVDDVLTSGASIAGCAMKIKEIYDGKIVSVTLARTGKRRKK